MPRNDEYSDIYGIDSCFVFKYRNRKLGKASIVDASEMDDLPARKHNAEGDDYIYIYCCKCNEYMDFVQGDPYAMNGHWICPSCRAKVRERTPYLELGRENRDWMKQHELTDEYVESGYDLDDPDYDWSDL